MANKVKITRHKTANEIGKRVKLPYTVSDRCPECDNSCERDLSIDGVEYPTPGEPINLYGYCDECDTEWDMFVLFDITLSKDIYKK